MPFLSLSLLGPLQILVEGEQARGFIYNKARALLVYLALESDRPHSRDALVGLFWPELPDAAARSNLRQALANLRQVLRDADAPSPYLLVSRDSIQFNTAADYELDVRSQEGRAWIQQATDQAGATTATQTLATLPPVWACWPIHRAITASRAQHSSMGWHSPAPAATRLEAPTHCNTWRK